MDERVMSLPDWSQTLRCALAELEGQGFITASCTEMRVPQDEERNGYALTQRRQQFR